jgi:hypothetical protein
MASNPVLVSDPKTILSKINTATVLNLGGIWGQVKAGQTWESSDGRRFILSADSVAVIYFQAGRIFMQASDGFRNEVVTYPMVAAGRDAHPWIQIAQVETKIICGIVAGATGVGFAAVISTEIAEFVVTNRNNFDKWQRQLTAVLKARALLKQHAPVLYDKVFNAVLGQVYKDVKGNIPDAVTPEVVAFGVGVVLGSVGKKACEGRFSLLAVIVAILEQLCVRFCISLVPGAINITEAQYRKLADQIIGQLRTAGVAIQDGDVRKIIAEVQKYPSEVKRAFDLLRDFR